jgi:hypothetical protein
LGYFHIPKFRFTLFPVGEGQIQGKRMKNLLRPTIAPILLGAAMLLAKDKPAVEKENLTKLQAVKTIFVDGNNESADKVRQHLESWTCLVLANNKSTADAVMDVKEQPKPNTDINKVAASMTITLPNGDLIWSRTKTGEGFIHSGAGEAVEKVLHDLSKDACPGSHYRRHMG